MKEETLVRAPEPILIIDLNASGTQKRNPRTVQDWIDLMKSHKNLRKLNFLDPPNTPNMVEVYYIYIYVCIYIVITG